MVVLSDSIRVMLGLHLGLVGQELFLDLESETNATSTVSHFYHLEKHKPLQRRSLYVQLPQEMHE